METYWKAQLVNHLLLVVMMLVHLFDLDKVVLYLQNSFHIDNLHCNHHH